MSGPDTLPKQTPEAASIIPLKRPCFLCPTDKNLSRKKDGAQEDSVKSVLDKLTHI